MKDRQNSKAKKDTTEHGRREGWNVYEIAYEMSSEDKENQKRLK